MVRGCKSSSNCWSKSGNGTRQLSVVGLVDENASGMVGILSERYVWWNYEKQVCAWTYSVRYELVDLYW